MLNDNKLSLSFCFQPGNLPDTYEIVFHFVVILNPATVWCWHLKESQKVGREAEHGWLEYCWGGNPNHVLFLVPRSKTKLPSRNVVLKASAGKKKVPRHVRTIFTEAGLMIPGANVLLFCPLTNPYRGISGQVSRGKPKLVWCNVTEPPNSVKLQYTQTRQWQRCQLSHIGPRLSKNLGEMRAQIT